MDTTATEANDIISLFRDEVSRINPSLEKRLEHIEIFANPDDCNDSVDAH